MTGSRKHGSSTASSSLSSALARLGVTAGAEPHELTRAYWRQARRLHPDVNPDPGATAQFQALCFAYRLAFEATSQRTPTTSPTRRRDPRVDPRPEPAVDGASPAPRSSGWDRPAGMSAAAPRAGTGVWLVAGPVHVAPPPDADLQPARRDRRP
jgi:hypothetical protein